MKKRNKKHSNEMIAELNGKIKAIKEEIKHDVSVPIVASFGFIIALVWRDALQVVLREFISRAGLLKEVWIYQIFSASIVTVAVIILMVIISKLSRKKKNERIQKILNKKTNKK